MARRGRASELRREERAKAYAPAQTFSVGDKVSFDPGGVTISGVITEMNADSLVIRSPDGLSWRLPRKDRQ